MAKITKSTLKRNDFGPVIDREAEIEDQVVNFVEFLQDVDATPLLKGCKDDRCQCPHWGYVIKGRFTMRYPDREETYEAGDAFYTPPGHIPVIHQPGTEIVMFSPTKEMRETDAVMTRNAQAMMNQR